MRRFLAKLNLRVLIAGLLVAAMLPAALAALFQTISAADDVRQRHQEELLRHASEDAAEIRALFFDLRAVAEALTRLEATGIGCAAIGRAMEIGDGRFTEVRVYHSDGTGDCIAPAAATASPAGKALVDFTEPVFFLSGESGTRMDLVLALPETEATPGLTAVVRRDVIEPVLARIELGLWTDVRLAQAQLGVVRDGPEFLPRAGEEGPIEVALPVLDQGGPQLVLRAPPEALPTGVGFLGGVELVFPFAMVLFGVLIAYIATDRLVVRHIRYLRRMAEVYGHGHLDFTPASARLGGPRELADLERSFGDMADRLRRREETLREALEDNRSLVSEVYHRVKNNLQMILSLINLQVRGLRDSEATQALEEIRTRVQCLSTVHQELRIANHAEVVRVDRVIRRLVEEIELPQSKGDRIALELAGISVPAERAVPLAMFILEALRARTRSDSREKITIVLTEDRDGGFSIATEGLDHPHGALPERLMRGFARQIRATLDEENGPDGARMVLRVAPMEDVPDRPGVAAGKKSLAAGLH